MSVIRIEGIAPWDGDYPLDLTYFTNRELHLIKQVSDIRAGEMADEFARGNNDLIVAVALIAAKRSGKDIPIDSLWDAPVGKITLEDDAADDVDDAGPPAKPLSPEPAGSSGVSVLPDRSGSSSSEPADDQPETTLSSTGSLG